MDLTRLSGEFFASPSSLFPFTLDNTAQIDVGPSVLRVRFELTITVFE